MQLKIRGKLFAGFSIIILVLVVVVLIGVNKIDKLNNLTVDVATNNVPSVLSTMEFEALTDEFRVFQLQYELTKDNKKRSEYEEEMNSIIAEIQENIDKYSLIADDSEKKLIQEFKGNYQDIIAINKELLLAAQNNDKARLKTLNQQATEKMDSNEVIVDTLKGKILKNANLDVENGKVIYRNATITMYSLLFISIILGLIIALIINRLISAPIKRISSAASEIAEGNLAVDIPSINTKDEIEVLNTAFKTMVENLRTLISEAWNNSKQVASTSQQLAESTEQTTKATEEIAQTVQEISSGMENQVETLNTTASTVERMASGIQQISLNTQKVVVSSQDSSKQANLGNELITKAVTQINSISSTVNESATVIKDLGERSKEIGQIVDIITGIAEQTNLLALNAAIEAARAGEQGRGFAVVAEEVRKLAEQSAGAAKQISELIKEIQSDTTRAVTAMEAGTKEVILGAEIINEAGDSFENILASVTHVVSQIEEISAAIEVTSTGSEEVVQAVKNIEEITQATTMGSQSVSAATEEQTATMEEMAASAATLSGLAQNLQNIINKFKM